MKIGGIGNLCLWCMEDMGESPCCPYCGHDEQEPQRVEQAIPAGNIIGGHYLIGRTLGQGGFGITYLAYDLDLHIKRAIKEYFPQGLVTRVGNTVKVTRQSVLEVYQKGVDSFYREAQAIARFGGHPNVVQVHAFFRENNSAYFVMDYVEGISFQQYLNDRGGRISWEETLRILKPIGEALTALHESRLLHRDVKPDNIFITRSGTPKLLDFGAARYETSETTHSSAAVLTPGYAPVEQYGSMSRQGTFTDVYGLSATFYRAVSGVVPVPAPDRMTEDPLLPLDKVDGRVPAHVGAALSHGMGVRSEKRTQTMAELLKELDTPVKEHHRLPKWLLPALLAVLVIGLGLWKFSGKPKEPAAATEVMEMDAAGTEEVQLKTLDAEISGTENALALAMVTPTETPEPTINPTREALLYRQTSIAETQTMLTVQVDTAQTPTDVPEPTETLMPTVTNTSAPTATAVPTATAISSIITEAIRDAQVGDTVSYGHYEQDNDLTNGAEAIEWRVLAREGNRLLLISEYGLDVKEYGKGYISITWEKCTLRKWLNGEFYKRAFSAEEQKQIADTNVKAEDNPTYGTDAGNDTQDRIFLLSIGEANAYFKSDKDRLCKITAYAAAKGAYRNANNGDTGWWWLRVPGYHESNAVYVDSSGSVRIKGSSGSIYNGSIRPVLWLNL